MSQNDAFEFITVHRRDGDPRDESWHKDVTKTVWQEFCGNRTLWNWAWIEYRVRRSHAEALKAHLGKLGYRVTSGDSDVDEDE